MKKNSFLAGAAISTLGIVITKFIGLVYVIPFYAIIGIQGGALYSYAYSIYNMFLNLATSGIPVAMSKVVSEYNAKNYKYTKEQTFKTGLKIIAILCVTVFLCLFIFAPQIAYFIIGDVKGGNTLEDVTFVIRVISTALLIVPFLSVSKGYLQGHKIMQVSSVANILEQIVRVIVILAGSYLALKVFHAKVTTAVGISVFAATVGAIAAYFYVFMRIKKNRDALERDIPITESEKKITTKDVEEFAYNITADLINKYVVFVGIAVTSIDCKTFSISETIISNVAVFPPYEIVTCVWFAFKLYPSVIS